MLFGAVAAGRAPSAAPPIAMRITRAPAPPSAVVIDSGRSPAHTASVTWSTSGSTVELHSLGRLILSLATSPTATRSTDGSDDDCASYRSSTSTVVLLSDGPYGHGTISACP